MERAGEATTNDEWHHRLQAAGAEAARRLRRGLVGMTPVGPGVRQVRVPGSSVLLLLDGDGGNGVTVVDAGSRGSLRAIRVALRRAGSSLRAVRRIVLTHYHPDHAGGLVALRAATRAPVWIHGVEAPFLTGERRPRNPFGDGLLGSATERLGPLIVPGPVPVERTLTEGDDIPAMGGLTVLHTPGHTAGSISLWQPARRWLFAADALQVIDGRLTLPSSVFSEDMAAARRSIRKLAALRPDTLVLSHYPPVRDAVADRLGELAASFGDEEG